MVQKVKTDIPGAKLVMYWCHGLVAIKSGCSTGHTHGDLPGRNCTSYPSYRCGPSAYQQSIQTAFKSSWATNQLFASNSSETPYCMYPGLASYVPFKESSDAIVDLIGNLVREVGFDGVYLDCLVRLTIFEDNWSPVVASIPIDSDGDGVANTLDEMVQQQAAWTPYFTSRLRQALGDDKIFIGNTAGACSDPSLNGITIETESCTDNISCTNSFLAQQYVGMQPPLGILWLTHSEVMPPEAQCKLVAQYQQMFPYLLAGTDFIDGSHVVCNNSLS